MAKGPTHFVSGALIRERLADLLPVGDDLADELHDLDDEPVDPFAFAAGSGPECQGIDGRRGSAPGELFE